MRKLLLILTTVFCGLTLSSQIVTTFPHIETFDGFSLCDTASLCALDSGWTNASNDSIDWSVGTGATTTASTGPTTDTVSGTGNYLFIESDSGLNNTVSQRAVVRSRYLDFSSVANPQVQFAYHMYGADMGTLRVNLESTINGSTSTFTVAPTFTSNIDNWQVKNLNLAVYAGQDSVRIVFIGITGGSGNTSDMAIDYFAVYDNLVVDAGNNTSIDCGTDTLVLGGTPTAQGGVGPYTYAWGPNVGLDDSTLANPIAFIDSIDTITYTLTVTDSLGLVRVDSITVIFHDVVGPVFQNCPGNFIITNQADSCNAVVTYTRPFAIDACSGLDSTWLHAGLDSGATFPVGVTNVIWRAIDTAGNITSCSFNVTVNDNQAPVITCPNDTTVFNSPGLCSRVVVYPAPTTVDNCPGEGVLQIAGLPSGGSFPVGVTVNTFVVTDASGNTDTCSFTVTVNDLDQPTIVTCPADFMSCDTIVTWTVPVAADNCELDTFFWTHAPGDTFPLGVTLVTYTAIDTNGNSTNCSFTVTVVPPLVADAGVDTALCTGDTISIGGAPTASGGDGGPYNYAWTPTGNLDTASNPNPNIYPTGGNINYIVTVTDTGLNCIDKDTALVVVRPLPLVDAGFDTFTCVNVPIQIGGTPTGFGINGPFTYSWTPVDSLVDATVANPTANYGAPGVDTFVVVVTDAKGCVSPSDSMILTVYPPTVITTSPDTTICYLDTADLRVDSFPFATYLWSNGSTDTFANPIITASTTYYVTVTDSNGCITIDSVVVTMHNQILIDAGLDTFIACDGVGMLIGGSPTASGGVGALTFAWLPAGGLDNTAIANPTATNTVGYYTYDLTVSDVPGCQVFDTTVVAVFANPVADAGVDTLETCVNVGAVLGGTPTATGGTPGYTYAWTPSADLDFDTMDNPTATHASADTLTYSVVVTDTNGCVDSDIIVLIVDSLPVFSYTVFPNDSVCLGDTIFLSIDSSDIVSWVWSTGTTDSIDTIVISGLTTWIYTTVTDTNGCMYNDSILLYQLPQPSVNAGPDTFRICQYEPKQLGVVGGATGGTPPFTYAWHTATNLNDSTAYNPFFTSSTPGDTMYYLTATDDSGCTAIDSALIRVNPAPLGDAGPDTFTCINVPITVGGSPTATGGTPPYTYAWSPPVDIVTVNSANPAITKALANTYTYEVVAIDSNLCQSPNDTMTLTVYAPTPVVKSYFPNDSACLGDTITLMIDSLVNGIAYAWSTGDTDTFTNVVITGPTATYYISATDSNGCIEIDSFTVGQFPQPIADAGLDTVSTCINVGTTLLGDTIGGTQGFVFAWSPSTYLDDSTLLQPVATMPTPGFYTHVLQATDANGCSAFDTTVVEVFAVILSDAGIDTFTCENVPIQIGGSPTALGGTPGFSYMWSTATNLDDSTIANPTVTIATAATYTYSVVVTDTNGCVSNPDTMTLNVYAPPVIAITASPNDSACLGDSIALSVDSIPGASYAWTGGSTDTFAYYVIVNDSATYFVTVTDSNGCISVDSFAIYQFAQPVADAGPDTTSCENVDVTIGGASTATGGTSPYTYVWNPSTGLTTPTDANPVLNLPADGIYTYDVIVTDKNNCNAYDTVVVEIFDTPVADAGIDTFTCEGVGIQIGGSPTATVGNPGYTYSWTPTTNLDDATIANPTATIATAAAYTYAVVVTDTNGCVSAGDTMTLTVYAPPVIGITALPNDSACLGDTITLTVDSINGASYLWSTTDTDTFTNVVIVGPTARYYVTVTDSNGCISIDSIDVGQFPQPIVDAGADTVYVCENIDLLLLGSSSGGKAPYLYTWTPATYLDNNFLLQPTANIPTAGYYTHVVELIDANGCEAYDTTVIQVYPTPITDAGSDTTTCENIPVTIGGNPTASGGTPGYTYLWTPASGLDNVTLANPSATQPVFGTYQYGVQVTDTNGCISSDTMILTVYPNPVVNLSAIPNDTICENDTVVITTVEENAVPTIFTTNNSQAGNMFDITAVNEVTIESFSAHPKSGVGSYAIYYRQGTHVGFERSPGAWNFVGLAGGVVSQPQGTPTEIPINVNVVIPAGQTYSFYITRTDIGGLVFYTNGTGVGNPLTSDPNIIIHEGTGNDYLFGSEFGPRQFNGIVNYKKEFNYHTFLWNNGKTTPFITENPPLGTTEYSVIVIDTNGCIGYDTIDIVVNPRPTADAGLDKAYCEDLSTTIGGAPAASGTVGPYTYSWSPTTGLNNPLIAQPTVSGLIPGNYTYELTVTDANGCTDTNSVEVTVFALPVVDAGNDTVGCPGDIITIGGAPTATGAAILTYAWTPATNLDDPSIANPNATLPLSGPLNYNVQVVDGNGCISNDAMVINVFNQPNVIVTPDTFCLNEGSALIAGTPTGGIWSGTGIVNVSTGEFDPATAGVGSHEVIYSVTNGSGCTNSDTVDIVVNSIPTVNITSSNTLCDNVGVVTLTADVLGGVWNGNGIINASTGDFDPSLAGTGVHTITYTVTDVNACSNTDTLLMTVYAAPVVNVTPAGPYCINDVQDTLVTSISGGTWGGIGIISASQGIFDPGTAGIGNHLIIYNYTNGNGCSDADTIFIDVTPIPNANINAAGPFCIDAAPVTLTAATAGGYWSGPGITNNNTGEFTPSTAGAGSHSIVYSVGSGGCFDIDTAIIVVNPLPVVSIAAAGPFCPNDVPSNLIATPGGGTWSGTGITNTSAGTFSPTVAGPGNHNITYVYTDGNGCTNSDMRVISVNDTMQITNQLRHVSCFGGNDGVLDVNVTGGTAPYTYSWSNGATTKKVEVNITAGNYTVTVTDALGCTLTRNVTITQPTAIVLVSSIVTDATNPSTNDGSIDITVSGGVLPYTYNWSTGANTEDLFNVPEGVYTITIKDANNCQTSFEIPVNSKFGVGVNDPAINARLAIYPNPTLDIVNIAVNGGVAERGAIEITDVTGRVVYTWVGDIHNDFDLAIDLSEQAAGQYFVNIYKGGKSTSRSLVIIK